MAIAHAAPADVIDVRPLGANLASAKTTTLIKTEAIEVIRLVMLAGKELKEHRAHGEIIVHCLEGRIVFTAFGKSQQLTAGEMLYLSAGEPHAVRCIDDASFLLTLVKGT